MGCVAENCIKESNNMETLFSIKSKQSSRPLSMSPLIGERISKSSGRKRVNLFKSPMRRI
jgi:hypothetical protein